MPLCPYCGEEQVLDLLEVWPEERAWLFDTCCEAFHEALVDDLNAALEMPPHERVRFLAPLRRLFADYGIPMRLVFERDLALDWDEGLRLTHATDAEIRRFIARHHEHNAPPVQWKWAHALRNGRELVAVATVERPKARNIANREPGTVEVTRVCTRRDLPRELTWNACSMLYTAAADEAQRRGYTKAITYTLEHESGHALEAAGWTREALSKGGTWNRRGRPRTDTAPTCRKWRWARRLSRRSAPAQLTLIAEGIR